MAIAISGGGAGITIETDPTAVKLAGSTMTGTLNVPEIGNILNSNLIIDSYNDTGAGTHYEHKFTPFDGKFWLAANGGGLVFPDGTTQTTAGLPLTGGTLSGKVNLAAPTAGAASLNLGVGTAPTSPINGDIWISGANIFFKDSTSLQHACLINNGANYIDTSAVNAALRVTQRGTGHAFVVEDSTTPDTTCFGIDNAGRVSINTNQTTPVNSYADLWVMGRPENGWAGYFSHTTGHGIYIQVSAGSSKDALQASGGPVRVYDGIAFGTSTTRVTDIVLPVVATGTYDKEIQINFAGANYRIPCRSV